jgi:hypothetical protein
MEADFGVPIFAQGIMNLTLRSANLSDIVASS